MPAVRNPFRALESRSSGVRPCAAAAQILATRHGIAAGWHCDVRGLCTHLTRLAQVGERQSLEASQYLVVLDGQLSTSVQKESRCLQMTPVQRAMQARPAGLILHKLSSLHEHDLHG